jgi:hypothetical protein
MTKSEAIQTMNRFIQETDWNAFWDRVQERCAPEIEAYRQARAKSLEHLNHVFLTHVPPTGFTQTTEDGQ